VPRDLATAVHVDDARAVGRPVGTVGPAPRRVDVRVLEQQHPVRASLEHLGVHAALQGPAVRIGDRGRHEAGGEDVEHASSLPSNTWIASNNTSSSGVRRGARYREVMNRTGRAGRPKASSRETLAEAACELFLERGYEATSIADITQRAGVSRSSFFNYFTSKSDVLWSGIDERIGVATTALDETGATAPMGRLAAELYDQFVKDGHAGMDFSGIITDIRDDRG